MSNKYFKGSRCNPEWEEMESPEAKALRGRGWMHFRRIVIATHQMRCDHCGVTLQELWAQGKSLDVHHKIKIREARHLRFEMSNCVVLCNPCHMKEEFPHQR